VQLIQAKLIMVAGSSKQAFRTLYPVLKQNHQSKNNLVQFTSMKCSWYNLFLEQRGAEYKKLGLIVLD